MNNSTNFFEGFKDYAEGITQEELEFDAFVVDTAIKLRKLREAAGLSVKEAAELCGICGCTPNTLSMLEAGEYNVTINTLWRYVKALGYELQISFVKED